MTEQTVAQPGDLIILSTTRNLDMATFTRIRREAEEQFKGFHVAVIEGFNVHIARQPEQNIEPDEPWTGPCDEDHPWQPGDIVRDLNGDLYWRTWDGKAWQFLLRRPGEWSFTPNLGPATPPLILIARNNEPVQSWPEAIRRAYDRGWRDRDALNTQDPIEPGPACPGWKPPA